MVSASTICALDERQFKMWSNLGQENKNVKRQLACAKIKAKGLKNFGRKGMKLGSSGACRVIGRFESS